MVHTSLRDLDNQIRAVVEATDTDDEDTDVTCVKLWRDQMDRYTDWIKSLDRLKVAEMVGVRNFGVKGNNFIYPTDDPEEDEGLRFLKLDKAIALMVAVGSLWLLPIRPTLDSAEKEYDAMYVTSVG